MWRILAVERFTEKLIELAIASCEAERDRILREERENYEDVWAVRVPAMAV